MHGYKWVSNSCYLDTVLWVLFSSPPPFVRRKLLSLRQSPIDPCGLDPDTNQKVFQEFQAQFRDMVRYFREGVGRDTCLSFRKLYKKWYSECPLLQKKIRFHSSEQQEAQEFLQFLLGLVGMNGQEKSGALSQETFYYGVSKVPRIDTVWKFIRERKDHTQSIVWNVPYDVLRKTTLAQRTLSHFLQRQEEVWNITTQYKKCDFNAIRTVHTLVRFADFLVISLERTHPLQQTISHFRVQVPPTLTDQRNKTLHLMGVICHHGKTANSGHYTAFAYSTLDNQWHHYDDMKLPLQTIGSWEDMKKQSILSTHSVLMFYTKTF